jgi:DNA-binding NarL/FixJ family response regulator
VLIVEDEFIIATVLKDRLEELGYTVVGMVSTGQDAIKNAEELHPDIVLMDIQLKGSMDGTQAAEIIWAVYNIPVIYLTSHSDDATLQKAMKTMPFGYIIKPFSNQILKTSLEMALYRYRTEMERWRQRENLPYKGN